ncbi:unnamed protein product [Caenorhabditis nigoni]
MLPNAGSGPKENTMESGRAPQNSPDMDLPPILRPDRATPEMQLFLKVAKDILNLGDTIEKVQRSLIAHSQEGKLDSKVMEVMNMAYCMRSMSSSFSVSYRNVFGADASECDSNYAFPSSSSETNPVTNPVHPPKRSIGIQTDTGSSWILHHWKKWYKVENTSSSDGTTTASLDKSSKFAAATETPSSGMVNNWEKWYKVETPVYIPFHSDTQSLQAEWAALTGAGNQMKTEQEAKDSAAKDKKKVESVKTKTVSPSTVPLSAPIPEAASTVDPEFNANFPALSATSQHVTKKERRRQEFQPMQTGSRGPIYLSKRFPNTSAKMLATVPPSPTSVRNDNQSVRVQSKTVAGKNPSKSILQRQVGTADRKRNGTSACSSIQKVSLERKIDVPVKATRVQPALQSVSQSNPPMSNGTKNKEAESVVKNFGSKLIVEMDSSTVLDTPVKAARNRLDPKAVSQSNPSMCEEPRNKKGDSVVDNVDFEVVVDVGASSDIRKSQDQNRSKEDPFKMEKPNEMEMELKVNKSSIETEKTEEPAENKKIGNAERKRQSKTKRVKKATEEDWDVKEKMEEKRISDEKREMLVNMYTYLDRMTEYRTAYFALHRKSDSSSVPSFESLAADIFEFSKAHKTSSTEDHEKLQKFLKRRLQEYGHSSKKVESNYKLHQLFDVLVHMVSTTQAFKHYLVLAQDVQFLEAVPKKDLKKMEKLYVKLVETFPKENEMKAFDDVIPESAYRCETKVGKNYVVAFQRYIMDQFLHRFKPVSFFRAPFLKEGSKLQYNLHQFAYGNQPNCDITRLLALLADEVDKLQDGAEKELQRKFISFLCEFDSLIISSDIMAHCDAYFNTGSSYDHIRDSRRQKYLPGPWLTYDVPSLEDMFGPPGFKSNVAKRYSSNGSGYKFRSNANQIQRNNQQAYWTAQVANPISGRQYPGFQMIPHNNVTGGNVPTNQAMVRNFQPIGPQMHMIAPMQSMHSNWNQCGTSGGIHQHFPVEYQNSPQFSLNSMHGQGHQGQRDQAVQVPDTTQLVRIDTASQTDQIQTSASVETQTEKNIQGQNHEIILHRISQIQKICYTLREDVEMNPIQYHDVGASTDMLAVPPKVANVGTSTENEPNVLSSFGFGMWSNVVADTAQNSIGLATEITSDTVVTAEIDKQETPEDRDDLNSSTVHISSSGATSTATVQTAPQAKCVDDDVMADWKEWTVGALLYVPSNSDTAPQLESSSSSPPKFFAGTFFHTFEEVHNGLQTKLVALTPVNSDRKEEIVSDDLTSAENIAKPKDSLKEDLHVTVAEETDGNEKSTPRDVVKSVKTPSELKTSDGGLNSSNHANSENIQASTTVNSTPGDSANPTAAKLVAEASVERNQSQTKATASAAKASSPPTTPLPSSIPSVSKNIDQKFEAEFPSLSDTARVVIKKDRSHTRTETNSDANALGFQWKKSSSAISPAGEQTRQKNENSKPRSTVQKQRQKRATVMNRQNVATDGKRASMEKVSTAKNVGAEPVKKSEPVVEASSPKKATENESKLGLATANVFSCLEVDMDYSIEPEAQNAEEVTRTTESTSSADPMIPPAGKSTNRTDPSKSSLSSQKKNGKNKKKNKKKTAQLGNDCIPEAPFDEEEESDPTYMCVNTYHQRMVDHRVRYMAFKMRDGSSTVPHFEGFLKKIFDYSIHRQDGILFSGTEIAMADQFVTLRVEHYRNRQNQRLFQFFKCLESIMKDECRQPPVVLIQDILYIIERCKTNQEKVDEMYYEAVQKFTESRTTFNGGFIDMELGKDIIDEEYRKNFSFYLQIQFRLRYCSTRSTDAISSVERRLAALFAKADKEKMSGLKSTEEFIRERINIVKKQESEIFSRFYEYLLLFDSCILDFDLATFQLSLKSSTVLYNFIRGESKLFKILFDFSG